jgi:protein TonB
VQTPREVPHFHQPTEVPREVPQDEPQDTDTSGAQEGGVVGGVKGGQVGGVVGGQIGGQIGGTLGGTLGGQIGGTGTGPVRVGGDVLAPKKISGTDPVYTEPARKARVQGIVILEAIIDANGNVTDLRVLKGLPLGLEDAAVNAVKRWKFQPGTLNGRPVPVYYNLTVNFQIP